MRLRSLALLALIATPSLPVRAADDKAAPTLVVRVASIDSLISDARYLADAIDKGGEAKQLEGIFRSFGTDKGVEGFDTTKPIALYGKLAVKIEQSDLVLMLPVVDDKAVLALLARFDIKPAEDKGVYKVPLPNVPFPAFFRFANGYVYITVRDAKMLDKDRLLTPAAVLPGKTGPLEIVLDVAAIPDAFKQVIISQTSLRLAEAKERKNPNETEAQHKFHVAALDEAAMQIKAIVTEGKELTVKLAVDRENAEVAASVRFTAKPGTKLAENIAEAGRGKSITGNLVGPGSAVSLRAHAALPPELRKAAVALFEDTAKQVADRAPAEVADLVKAFGPTVKAGVIDFGFDLRGPGENGRFNGVIASAIKDGDQVDKAFRALYAIAPAEAREVVKLDVDKAAGIEIHRITPPAEAMDAEFKRVLGDGPIYFAIRKDAIVAAAGPKALDNLKDVLVREPKIGKLLQVEASVSRAVALDKREDAMAMAKKVFGTGDDKVRLTLEGGKALEARLSIKTKVIAFVVQLEEERKKGQQ